MVRSLVTMTLCAGLLGCPASARKDFDLACAEAKALSAKPPSTFDGPGEPWWDQRRAQWVERVEAKARNDSFLGTFRAVAHAAPGSRASLLEAAAREQGLKDWRCPALEPVLAPAEEDLERLCAAAEESGTVLVFGTFRPQKQALLDLWPRLFAARPPERLPLLKAAAEWPERTFKSCAVLERLLLELADPGAAPAP